jgi:4-aminobutyrate aminotransferase-like enzyme
MMGGNPKLRAWIPHPDPEIYHLPFPWRYGCPWRDGPEHQCLASCFHKSLQQLADKGVNLKSIASIMIESYLGWGALFYTPEYIQAIRQWADEQHALMVFDEVQSGFGRTGTWFAFEHYGVKPDLVCLGKGISSSLPMSALLGRKDLLDKTDPGSMSSTHSGNPLCCAAALANLTYLENENIIAQAADKGKLLRELLLDLQKQFSDRILSIEGRGMVYGVILVKPGTTEEDATLGDRIAEKAMQKGLLIVHTGRGSLKLGPPLTIPEDAIREAINVLKESIDECLPLEKATT